MKQEHSCTNRLIIFNKNSLRPLRALRETNIQIPLQLIITFIILNFLMCFPVKAQNRDTTVANYYFHLADSLRKALQYDTSIYFYQKAREIYLALATSVEGSAQNSPSPLV